MKNTTVPIKPEQVIEIILRRRWFIIIPFILSMITGICLSIFLPKIYEAKTLILVEAQSVPRNYVQSIVSADINTRINTIYEQILSRTNLERIIKNLNVFSGPKYNKMFLEDKVVKLRENIVIDVNLRRGVGSGSFTVSYRGEDPEKGKQIVNTIATHFIDENLNMREAQAVGTNKFLEGELNSMRKKLEQVESKMRAYRKNNMGELPEQLESNLRILDRLQEKNLARQDHLSDLKGKLSVFERQQEEKLDIEELGADTPAMKTRGTRRLVDLKYELADLRTKYTEQHPDIISLKKRITDIEQDVSRQENAAANGDTEGALIQTSIESRLTRQIRVTTLDIANIEKEIAELEEQIEIYKKRVENTPKREQELMGLRRDYKNIQESYSSLLSRKLESEIAVNMEQKQKGERFRILDPAKISMKSVKPNIRNIFLLSLAAAFGIGGGLIFLLEYFDKSFRHVEDVEQLLGLPVVAAVPQIRHPEIRRMKKIEHFFTVFSIIISLVLLVGFAVIVLKGPDQTIEIARSIINGQNI